MATHDLPCFCSQNHNSCSLYQTPAVHLHCFSCGKQKYDLTDDTLLEMELNLSQTNLLQMDAARPHIVTEIKRGVITTLEDRSLTKETAEKYRVEKLFDETDRPIGYAFNYWNEDGTIYAQKVKKLNKMGMQWNGVHDTIPGLFGQSLFPSGGKFITITEGEEDAMAAYQILKAASPSFEPVVVSIVDGAASVEKCCKKAWEYINSFENIILSFDGDEAGIRAAEKISKLFNYRPKVILFSEAKKNKEGAWELKDANDYLKANRSRDFINMWWKADKMTPKGVLTMKSMWQHMIKKDSNTMVPYPWPGATKMLHGLITGHFVVIKAAPKVGKTQILKEIAYHIHTTSPHNVGLIFLENTKKEIGLGLCALHMNKPIKPWEIPDDLAALATAHEFLSQDDRITIFDPEDSRTVENIMAKILYFVKAHNCRYILLDHITMLSYQSGDDNERRFIDKLCADLKELTTSLDICIIAVTHVNDDGKARGSRASAQLCDSTIMLERDKTSDDPIVKNTTKFIVEDNRWGECGTACNLFYNQTDGRMTELDFDLETGADKERTVEFDK